MNGFPLVVRRHAQVVDTVGDEVVFQVVEYGLVVSDEIVVQLFVPARTWKSATGHPRYVSGVGGHGHVGSTLPLSAGGYRARRRVLSMITICLALSLEPGVVEHPGEDLVEPLAGMPVQATGRS